MAARPGRLTLHYGPALPREWAVMPLPTSGNRLSTQAFSAARSSPRPRGRANAQLSAIAIKPEPSSEHEGHST